MGAMGVDLPAAKVGHAFSLEAQEVVSLPTDVVGAGIQLEPDDADQASSAPTSSQSSSGPVPKRNYPAPAETPTQGGPKGLRFDFNNGCRVLLPERERPWRVRLSDISTGNIVYETEIKTGRVNSSKRYFVRFGIGERVYFATTTLRPGAMYWCNFQSGRWETRSAGFRMR